jgi:peptidoglycan-N-acetylglucosamine deacetylase
MKLIKGKAQQIIVWIIAFLVFFACKQKTTAPKLEQEIIAQKTIQDTSKKYVYLTFDDGPINGSTQIDSLIKAEKIKASVFLVGKHGAKSTLLGIDYSFYFKNPYLDCYNHTYSHGNDRYKSFYANTDTVLADIKKNDSFFHFGHKNMRLAGRNIWNTGKRKRVDSESGSAASDALVQNGYKLYGWDIEWHHGKNGKPIQSVDRMLHGIEWIFENKKEFTKNNLVVLMHDEMFQKPIEINKLKAFIEKLRMHSDYVFEQIRFYPD